MQVLITLKVKYGYPLSALQGFITNGDHEVWEMFLKDISYEVCVSQQEGQIYLLGQCSDVAKAHRELNRLPLLQE